MRKFTLAICAGLALAPSAALAAPTATGGGVAADARCLLTMAALTSSKDENRAKAAQVGVIYFAGRIKAQQPGYNFGVGLKPIAASMTRETLVSEAQRCGPLLTETLRELDQAQKAFPQPAAAAPGAKAPPATPPTKP